MALSPLIPGAALDRVTDVLVDRVTRRVTLHDRASLESMHRATGPALVQALVARAVRDSGRVGAAGGAVASVQWAAPVTFLAAPAEVVAEALATAWIEIALIADLHVVHAVPLPAEPRARAIALVQAWAEERGVRMSEVTSLPRALGSAGRRSVRHRLVVRLARNLGSFAPLLVGAAIGASLNRRETRRLAQAVTRDLATRGVVVAD